VVVVGAPYLSVKPKDRADFGEASWFDGKDPWAQGSQSKLSWWLLGHPYRRGGKVRGVAIARHPEELTKLFCSVAGPGPGSGANITLNKSEVYCGSLRLSGGKTGTYR
jgi:hypothetical protein